jgi:hypothetical protein
VSSRPERRKSQLAGASPVQPAPVTSIAAVPEPVEPAAKPQRNGGWSQVSIRLVPRTPTGSAAPWKPPAARHLPQPQRVRLPSGHGRGEPLEQEHNGGKPWNGVTAGDLTPGRRPGN